MLTDEQAQAVIEAVYEAAIMSIIETDTRPQCVRITTEVEENEVSLVFECEPIQWQPVDTATEVWIHPEAWSRARSLQASLVLACEPLLYGGGSKIPQTLFGLPVIKDDDAS